MDLDGTISTEVAIKDKDERSQVATLGLGNKNDGTPMTAELALAAPSFPRARRPSTSPRNS